tara:strand:- start:1790 stop:2056 length:267 start_codon:yes stop_codon:yes gene_type:complete
MFYQEILLSMLAISWVTERIYFYKIHDTNRPSDGLLNLNAPLASSYTAQYNPITLPENINTANNTSSNSNTKSNKDSQLNDFENHSHL